MYLFDYKDEITIKHTCKLCLKEISFTISRKEYSQIEEFPIGKEFIHGDPSHRLILYINKNLEVEKFKIEDVIDTKSEHLSQELTRQVLSNIELTDEEIKLYFLTTGRGAVSLAEMAFLIDNSKEECQKIAERFIEKGLYKEIMGASPHYFALPPYAALVYQLQEFQTYAQNVKESTYNDLTQSFSQLEAEAEGVKKFEEFSEYIVGLKQNLLSQMSSQKASVDSAIGEVDNIKNITEIISNLENDVKKTIDNQLLLIKKKKMKEELERFFRHFELTLKESLGKTIVEINEIVNKAETAKANVKKTFADVSKDFSQVLMEGEEKLANIAEGVSSTLTNVKNTFSTKVLETFNEMIEKILSRLEVSEITTKQFWEQAKKTQFFTMRDVWFIKSIEGIKAQIKDEIPKCKMRLLIVAPQLTDIDVEPLKNCPKHANLRIATYVDIHNGAHVEILKKLNEIPNVNVRLREKQDIWGLNRDSEVIIVSALSYKDGKIAEIAGLGTSQQEHIKIFIPLVEEAWMSASKHIDVIRKNLK